MGLELAPGKKRYIVDVHTHRGIVAMQVSLARRALFTGRIADPMRTPVRPPWALLEPAFLDRCSRCDACVKTCESGIITRGDGGYPHINFTKGECTFCRACVDACEDGALALSEKPWNLTARIAPGCLSADGVTCRVCGDRCDTRAISFQLAVGGVANPKIDPSACTGCGACVAPCPTGVITIEHVTEEAAT